MIRPEHAATDKDNKKNSDIMCFSLWMMQGGPLNLNCLVIMYGFCVVCIVSIIILLLVILFVNLCWFWNKFNNNNKKKIEVFFFSFKVYFDENASFLYFVIRTVCKLSALNLRQNILGFGPCFQALIQLNSSMPEMHTFNKRMLYFSTTISEKLALGSARNLVKHWDVEKHKMKTVNFSGIIFAKHLV